MAYDIFKNDRRLNSHREFASGLTYAGTLFVGWGLGYTSAIGHEVFEATIFVVFGGTLIFWGHRLREHVQNTEMTIQRYLAGDASEWEVEEMLNRRKRMILLRG